MSEVQPPSRGVDCSPPNTAHCVSPSYAASAERHGPVGQKQTVVVRAGGKEVGVDCKWAPEFCLEVSL